MMGGSLTGTELLHIVYLKNSMKIMRVGRWEPESSRISILLEDREAFQGCQILSVNNTDLRDLFHLRSAANIPLIGSVIWFQMNSEI